MTKNSEQRNILLIHQHFCPPGGFGNNRSYEIAKALIQEGHRVTILTGSGNFVQQPEYLFSTQYIDGIQVDCIRVAYQHRMSYARRIYAFLFFLFYSCMKVFRYRSCDVVYTVSTPLSVGIIGFWYKRILKKPFIFEIGDLWPDVPVEMGIVKNTLLIKILYWLERRIYEGSSHIVLLAEGMKEKMLAKGIRKDKLSVLYNGTNIQQFFPSADKQQLRNKHRIPTDVCIVLYAGTMGIANGLEFFIDAAEELQRRGNQQVVFYFIGDGNSRKAIEEMVLKKKLRNVVFLNSMPKNEVEEYFRLADIGIVSFAHFQILETNSANKYYDYLASGLPVLINYKGWQQKALESNSCGYSVANPIQAADILGMLSNDPVLYHKMSVNARALAIAEYDRRNIAKALSALILQHSVSSEAYSPKA